MKTLISLIAIVLFMFIYSGCTDDNSIIQNSGQENSDKHVFVPWKGFADGLVYPQAWNCDTLTYGRLGIGTGKSSHMGLTNTTFMYCVKYLSSDSGIIINSGDTSVFEAANHQKVWMYITGGYFNIVDTVMMNDSAYMKITAVANGDVFGGTGKFNDADGSMVCDATQYIKIGNPLAPSPCYMRWSGIINY